MGFQVDRATKIDFFGFGLKEVAKRDLRLTPTVTPILALAKGNCQMGFQVDQAINIDFLVKRDR